MTQPTPSDAIRDAVRDRYGRIAASINAQRPTPGPELTVLDSAACCAVTDSGEVRCGDDKDLISRDLYDAAELAELPSAAVLASLGCGNPAALAELKPGEVVLDLGSGGGIDVLLSARRVGSTGFAYGLDMTDEMLELAERNRAAVGATNVTFLKGHIEAIPLPDNHVDVVISNCVINLSADKARALREAFRVLKPGGRFAVSDIVVQGQLPAAVRRSLELWAGCVAGALDEPTYRRLLAAAGFQDVEVEVTRVYDPKEACTGGGGPSELTRAAALSALEAASGRLVSAFMRARKPLEAAS